MKKSILMGLAITFMFPFVAQGIQYDFYNITNNGNPDLAGQLNVDVTQSGSEAWFMFTNNVGIASSITDIYFDFKGDISALMSYSSLSQSSGVTFSPGAAPPNLPGGNGIAPKFDADLGYDSDSGTGGTSSNGINLNTEWATLKFTYNTTSFADVLAALNSGDLRIGLHVQAIGKTSGSDSYVNSTPIPEPTTTLLVGLGVAGLAGVARRRRS